MAHIQGHDFAYIVATKTANNEAILADLLIEFPFVSTNGRQRQIQKKTNEDIPSSEPFADNGQRFGAWYIFVKLILGTETMPTFEGDVLIAEHGTDNYDTNMATLRLHYHL